MAILGGWRLTRTGVLFVVGVVVLVALVGGAIWYVRERGEQARRDEAIKIAEQNLETQSNEPVAISTENGQSAGETSDDEATSTPAAESSSAELPQTGFEPYSILVIGILALAASYYASSRRALARL